MACTRSRSPSSWARAAGRSVAAVLKSRMAMSTRDLLDRAVTAACGMLRSSRSVGKADLCRPDAFTLLPDKLAPHRHPGQPRQQPKRTQFGSWLLGDRAVSGYLAGCWRVLRQTADMTEVRPAANADAAQWLLRSHAYWSNVV